MENSFLQKESPFACNLMTLAAEERKEQAAVFNRVCAARVEVRELADGYAFRFANDTEMIRDLGAFISYERLCCPFLNFALTVEHEGGALWLSLTGREGAKSFIQAEFGF